MSDLYTHDCLLHSVFAILYIAYLYICIVFFLLSVSCPVAFILLHCGALSLQQIPCMCKHTWPIKLILIIQICVLINHINTHTYTFQGKKRDLKKIVINKIYNYMCRSNTLLKQSKSFIIHFKQVFKII